MTFSAGIRSALLSLVVSALAVSAAPGLSLSVTGPDSVKDVHNFFVVATVQNTGDQTLKLLNDPRTPLSKVPTDTFNLTHDNGGSPSFTGVRAKYVKELVANADREHSFTVLAPGQSIEVTHDLSDAYNFTTPGQGKYSVEARNLFHYIDPANNTLVPIQAGSGTYATSVSGRLVKPRSEPTMLNKRSTFNHCNASQQQDITLAQPAAQKYADDAYSYLQLNAHSTNRSTTWFGQYTDIHHTILLAQFSNMSGAPYANYNFDCNCTESDLFAYVYPDQFGTIYLCGAFWTAPMIGSNSKAGTLVHESTHFEAIAGTLDIAYGEPSCQQLALTQPEATLNNADSHEFFAENDPVLP